MKKILTLNILSVMLFAMPFAAVAQTASNQTFLKFYKDLIVNGVNVYLVPVLIAIAFITFLWGVYKYFIQPDGEREEGRQFIMYGIIGFVIIVSVWGLVNMVRATLIPSSTTSTRPDLPSSIK